MRLSDAISEGTIPNAEIAIVFSDKASARGLELAAQRGIETRAIERRGRTREEHEQEIIAVLRERQVDLVCLAGYMRLLSPCFVEAFRGQDTKHSSESFAVVSRTRCSATGVGAWCEG